MIITVRRAEIKGNGAKLLFQRQQEEHRKGGNLKQRGIIVNQLLNEFADYLLQQNKKMFTEFFHEQIED